MDRNLTDGQPEDRAGTEVREPVQPRYEEVLFYEHKPAGFWVRLWAYVIDLLVIASVIGIAVNPIFYLAGWEVSSSSWYAPIVLISSLIFYGYFVLMTKFFSQTVGKMILGIRVVSLKEDKLDWGTILFREWIGRIFSANIWPLYWIVGFTKNKQGIHDFIADTTVIHEQSYREMKKVVRNRNNGPQLPEAGTV